MTPNEEIMIGFILDLFKGYTPKERVLIFRHLVIDYCPACGKNIIHRNCHCEDTRT